MTRSLSFLALIGLTVSLSSCSAPDTSTLETEMSDTDAAGVVTPPQIPTLSERWTLTGFDSPESVIATQAGDGYYVSNVGGEGSAVDGDGAISLISNDGVMIERNWVTGTDAMPLNAPKGMALMIGGTLAVTDIDHIALINGEAGVVTFRLPVPGAVFLNDIVTGPNGMVLVSDSGAERIYLFEDSSMPTIWLEDDRLAGINGLHNAGDHLLVTTMSAGELLRIDWDSKAITPLAGGMDNADGIGVRADGSYIISSWPGQLWHVRDGETPTLLQDTSGETGAVMMNDILLVNGETLVTPNWMPGTVRAYAIE